MKISDLKPRMGNLDIEVEVISIEEPRTFDKFGKSIRVANAEVKDDTGTTKLTLWNDDIEKVKPGMKVKITNGYVNEFQGEMQLTSGKFGKLEILDPKKNKEDKKMPEEEQTEEESTEEEKPKEKPAEEEETKPEGEETEKPDEE